MARALLLWVIGVYRSTRSPLSPPRCRFEPTCSQYGYEAVDRYGAWRGGWMTLRRIARCHPFHQQEFDPVP